MMIRGRVKRFTLVALLAAISIGTMGFARVPPPPGKTTVSNSPAPAIPEPAGFVVFAVGAGLVGLALHRRSRQS